MGTTGCNARTPIPVPLREKKSTSPHLRMWGCGCTVNGSGGAVGMARQCGLGHLKERLSSP
jgi:hypothetical protein